MLRTIPKQTKEEIVSRIKQGEQVKALTDEYGVGDRAIYGWLQKRTGDNISLSKFNRLKRERDDLLTLVGELIEAIHYWMNYYNKQRIHASLNASPAKFHQQYLQKYCRISL